MGYHKSRRDTTNTPDVVEITLYYWDTSRWLIDEIKPKSIRFHVIGKALGPSRWRPHLIQYKDPLPIQGNKDLSLMLDALKTSISTTTNLECVPITKDLLDCTNGEDE